jgi:hypothetical protein
VYIAAVNTCTRNDGTRLVELYRIPMTFTIWQHPMVPRRVTEVSMNGITEKPHGMMYPASRV